MFIGTFSLEILWDLGLKWVFAENSCTYSYILEYCQSRTILSKISVMRDVSHIDNILDPDLPEYRFRVMMSERDFSLFFPILPRAKTNKHISLPSVFGWWFPSPSLHPLKEWPFGCLTWRREGGGWHASDPTSKLAWSSGFVFFVPLSLILDWFIKMTF